jgi:type II secretory pathway pseudopilin PulG
MGVAILAFSALATLASAGVSIYGQRQAAKTQERAAEYNHQIAENEARHRELETAEQVKRRRVQDKREMATLRNNLAASGTLTTEGTPLAILGESSAFMDLAIQDAVRQSTIEAASIRARGQMGLWEASQASRASRISSIGTALGGFSSAVTAYRGTA